MENDPGWDSTLLCVRFNKKKNCCGTMQCVSALPKLYHQCKWKKKNCWQQLNRSGMGHISKGIQTFHSRLHSSLPVLCTSNRKSELWGSLSLPVQCVVHLRSHLSFPLYPPLCLIIHSSGPLIYWTRKLQQGTVIPQYPSETKALAYCLAWTCPPSFLPSPLPLLTWRH